MKNKISHKNIIFALIAQNILCSYGAWALDSVEIGGVGVSENSAKFGEYDGLNQSHLDGSFDINGGNAYNQQGGKSIWGISGNDLGTTSRSLKGTMSDQGAWQVGLNFDELRHNISDSYQTLQQGKMGSSVFTLPKTLGTIDGTNNTLNSTQVNAFHTTKINTTRNNTSVNATYIFTPNSNLKFDYNHLDQKGAKLLGTSTATEGNWLPEAVNIIMNPTKYKTDSYNLAFNWGGEKGHVTASYNAQMFHDSSNGVSWENPLTDGTIPLCASGTSCTYQASTMSTAPSNSFHRFNLLGRYIFSPTTKLAGGLSYGLTTQDEAYLNDAPTLLLMQAGLPQNSLNGRVITTHGDWLLTNQTTSDLTLSAGMKYNQRENQSSSNTYNYNTISGINYTAINTPFSNQKMNAELNADYQLRQGHNLHVAFERENVKRWCNREAYGSQCVSSPSSSENKLGANYRLTTIEDMNFNVGYSYANRNAEFDHSFLSPIAASTATPKGGINGDDILGFVAVPFATRKEHALTVGTNWQTTEKLNLGVNGNYTKDTYDATLGVQDANSDGLNLDATYSYSDSTSFSTFASWQNAKRTLKNGFDGDANTAPTQIWNNNLQDESYTIGFNSSHRGLMTKAMEITTQVSYALDTSKYSTQVPYDATCSGPAKLTCGNSPDIQNKVLTVKISDHYKLNQNSKINLGYTYQHRNSADFYYNGIQYGYTPTGLLPTNEQPPVYTVHLVVASYTYTF